jgi:hypothetical protein
MKVTESAKNIRWKYAILPEEKALLTQQGRRLVNLTDIAALVGGTAKAAAPIVQKIVKQE